MVTCSVSNWGWIASVAVRNYPSAGDFLVALALAHVAPDASAVREIMRVFAEFRQQHSPVTIVRSEN